MDRIKQQLLSRAQELHGRIRPTCNCASLEECFTVEGSRLIFWFNDEQGSTKVLVRERPTGS